jgi:cell division protein FtsL
MIVGMLLFSAWQHFEIVNSGYKVERLRVDKAAEESFNRKLRLELETLRRPQHVESVAIKQLRMVAPTSADTLVIERTTASVPGRAIIASNR